MRHTAMETCGGCGTRGDRIDGFEVAECTVCGEEVCATESTPGCAGAVDHDGEVLEGRMVGYTTMWCKPCHAKENDDA